MEEFLYAAKRILSKNQKTQDNQLKGPDKIIPKGGGRGKEIPLFDFPNKFLY